MSETKRIRLAGRAARANAVEMCGILPEGWTATFAPPKRNNDQNALLHSLLGEIAGQVEWGGKRWDAEDWKRLLTAAWMRTRQQQALMVPALDGHGFEVLYRRTSSLSKAECAELIDYVTAWAVEQGVTFAEHTLG
jgi:hypothetical protein